MLAVGPMDKQQAIFAQAHGQAGQKCLVFLTHLLLSPVVGTMAAPFGKL